MQIIQLMRSQYTINLVSRSSAVERDQIFQYLKFCSKFSKYITDNQTQYSFSCFLFSAYSTKFALSKIFSMHSDVISCVIHISCVVHKLCNSIKLNISRRKRTREGQQGNLHGFLKQSLQCN